MKIICLSDTHGSLPDIEDGDLLLIGGDLCASSNINHQYNWLGTVFRNWVIDLVGRGIKVISVEGNHGLLAGRHPEYFKEVSDTIPWTYLEDSSTEFEGKVIWGTPSSLPFGAGWAFNVSEKDLKKKYKSIPEGTDIIISHGPPYGYGDVVGYKDMTMEKEHLGSKSLLDAIDRIRPKLVCVGHIHEGYGVYKRGDTTIVNAAYMDGQYRPVNKPILVEI